MRFFGLRLYFHRFFGFVDFPPFFLLELTARAGSFEFSVFRFFPIFLAVFRFFFSEILCVFAVYGNPVDPLDPPGSYFRGGTLIRGHYPPGVFQRGMKD